MKKNKEFRLNNYFNHLILLLMLALLSACGGGGGGSDGEDNSDEGDGSDTLSIGDMSGTWRVKGTESSATSDCDGTNINVIATVVQSGNNLTVTGDDGSSLFGTISGNTISLSGTYPEDGGTTVVNSLTATITDDCNQFSGSDSWSWTNGVFSCSGTSTFNSMRLTGNGCGDTIPSAPQNIQIVSGDSQASISWNSVSGATSYNIYWNTIGGVTTSDNQIVGATSPYVHTSLTNGTAYYYIVTAVNAAGESTPSSEVSATSQPPSGPPSAPQNIQTSSGNNQVTVSWNNVSGATSYNIYWNTTGNVTVLDEQIENVTPPYLHSNISNNTTYYYVVTAVNAIKESNPSLEVFETPLTSNIVAPTEVHIIPGDGRVRVAWNDVLDVDGYIIYWSTSDNPLELSSFKREGASTVFVRGGFNNGVEYTFSVSAFNALGESARSNSVIVIPDLFSSSGVSVVSAGHWGTTCAVRMDGSLWCWGDNSNGMFGNGTEHSTSIPVQIDSDYDWKSVSVGFNHTCALKSDDSLWCWGFNYYGQIAAYGVSRSNIPVQVGADRDWGTVYVGSNSTCALKIDGTLWCWGRNKIGSMVGVLGVGSDSENVLIPSQVGISSNWISFEGTEGHLCALNDGGELWCWGNIVGSNTPLFIDGMGWLDVDVSGASDLGTCLIKQTDGSRWCWGDNRDGRLGNGTTDSVSSLSQMSNDSGWMDISGGVDHICGLHTDKSISCWGYDRYRLGAGTDVDMQLYPTPIAGNSQWLQLDAGGVHTCAIRDDYTLWCWGSGRDGQLGIGVVGSSASRSIPVAVTNAGVWP